MTKHALPQPGAPLTPRQILVVFSGLVLSMLLAALDSTIVATALPTIVSELGGLERLAWVVTAYLLAQTVVTPLYGKLGDLYGRKRILQSAIVLFLVGSALCGLSRSMMQLILFRFVQGLGGGGLIVTTQAAIADIVPARDRGKYMGIFGAVFGVASIAGPLLGGYFTTAWSWRWIFYINVPVGLLALVVLGATLPATSRRARHAIDYAGAALLAVVLSSITLFTDLGGTVYPWSAPIMRGLLAACVVALVLFVVTEHRATEPVLPLSLFRNRVFSTTVTLGAIVGFAMFGTVTYMPVFLQVVTGASPTGSGLLMVPMMGGMLSMSILSGQLISRTGRYKIFPILGTLIMSVGLFMLSRITAETTRAEATRDMLVLGLGMGLIMQVLVLAVQNAVEHRHVGVATSGATLFRFIGGSLGTAVLGAVFASRLTENIAAMAGPAGDNGAPVSMQGIAMMDAASRLRYAGAFAEAIQSIFLIGLAVAAIAIPLALLLPETPLRRTVAAHAASVGDEMSEAMAIPHTPETDEEDDASEAALPETR